MKKILAMLLCAVLTVGVLTGCSGSRTADTAATDMPAGEVESDQAVEDRTGEIKGMTVGYCMPDTSESFLAGLSNGVKELFEADGVKVDIADAAGNSTTQISQIENFAASGTDLIIIMAVDPTGVTDAIKRAQESGSMVMVAGSNPGAYDAIMYTDQFEDGCLIAEMGADWIEKTFPDAEPGSIEIALFEDRSTPEATQRCEGMNTITELTDKVKVAQVVGSIKNNDPAQAAMENVMQTNPDIRMVLCYNSSGAMGVNEYAMRAGSGVKDTSQFAVFCSDLDPAALSQIADSAQDKAVLRGLIKFGSNDLTGDTYRLAKKMLSGEDFDVENPDPLTKITPENVADFQE